MKFKGSCRYHIELKTIMAIRRIKTELMELEKEPRADCSAAPEGNDYFQWRGTIKGPAGTPYEGGVFNLLINFPENYPFKPPRVKFTNQVYHPNISSNGEICLDILDKDWSPTESIGKVLLAIISLLDNPNANNPLVPEIAEIYKKAKGVFDTRAAEWTKKYAT